jgi:EmrB/QacA subfamily drug resistance transporter
MRCGSAAISSPAGKPVFSPSWTLFAAILGSSMAFIDGTVVNVALPAIQQSLNTDVAGAQWVVEGYALLLSALLLVGGALGDRLGRRRVFGVGVGLFAIASALCGAAPSIQVLVAARVLQGVAAALLTPGSLALISAAYEGEARGKAIGTWSALTAITAAVGPLLGGLLIQYASWRWAFLINLPIAVVVLALVIFRVPESRDDEATGRLDWPGAALATAGLGLLVVGLIRSQTDGLGDALAILCILVGIALLIVFAVLEGWEEGHGGFAPMMPLSLFASRPFTTTNILTFLLYAALGGVLFFVPLELIEVRGFSPAQAGAALLPFIVLLSTLSRFTGGVSARIGPRLPLTVGPLIAAAGFLLFAVGAGVDGYVAGILPAVIVLGLGMSITVAPLTTTVMGSVETRHAGAASGVNNAVSRAAGLLAVALLGLVVTNAFNSSLDSKLAGLQLPSSAVQSIDSQRTRLALIEPPASLDSGVRSSVTNAVHSAFDDGYRDAMFVGAGLALASAAVAAVGLRPPRRRGV